MSHSKVYYTELSRAVVHAANCLQYDNAAALLRLGVAYGPNDGVAPELVGDAVCSMQFYESMGDQAYLEAALYYLESYLSSK